MRRFSWSILSTLSGGITTFALALFVFGDTNVNNIVQGIATIVLLFSTNAWVLFILPATLWFTADCRIYYFRYSIPTGIFVSLIAFSLYVIVTDIYMNRPTTIFEVFTDQEFPLLLTFPIIFGVCAAATLSILSKRAIIDTK